MANPSIIEPDLRPADMAMLRRLMRTRGEDDPGTTELDALRTSVDELADELADLRIALDARKTEILSMAETDTAWRKIADLAWPAEEHSHGP